MSRASDPPACTVPAAGDVSIEMIIAKIGLPLATSTPKSKYRTRVVNAGSNYAREDYAFGGSSSEGSNNNQSGGSGGSSTTGETKSRMD